MKKNYMEKILELGSVVNFLALIGVVFLQVFSRFFLPKAPSWTEELSRILFIYAIAFAAPLALKRGEYVKVDILVGKLSEKAQRILESCIYILLTLFFSIIAYSGVEFSFLGQYQTSPAMGFTMMYSYIALGISGIFMTLYAIVKFIEKIKKEEGEKDVIKEWN